MTFNFTPSHIWLAAAAVWAAGFVILAAGPLGPALTAALPIPLVPDAPPLAIDELNIEAQGFESTPSLNSQDCRRLEEECRSAGQSDCDQTLSLCLNATAQTP